jgi:hypothetical protein
MYIISIGCQQWSLWWRLCSSRWCIVATINSAMKKLSEKTIEFLLYSAIAIAIIGILTNLYLFHRMEKIMPCMGAWLVLSTLCDLFIIVRMVNIYRKKTKSP